MPLIAEATEAFKPSGVVLTNKKGPLADSHGIRFEWPVRVWLHAKINSVSCSSMHMVCAQCLMELICSAQWNPATQSNLELWSVIYAQWAIAEGTKSHSIEYATLVPCQQLGQEETEKTSFMDDISNINYGGQDKISDPTQPRLSHNKMWVE